MILLLAETLGGGLSRKQKIAVVTETEYDRLSRQEAKVSRLVYILCVGEAGRRW